MHLRSREEIPDEAIMTPHFYLLQNVNNVTIIMADLAVTALFLSLSRPIRVLCWQWNSLEEKVTLPL